MRTDATTPLEKELLSAMYCILDQLDEDLPFDIRSRDLDDAIEDARRILFPIEEEAKA